METDKRSQLLLELLESQDVEPPLGATGQNWAAMFALLASRKKLIALVTIAGGVVAAALAFLIPNKYTATAMILTPTKPQSLSAAMTGQLGGMASVLAPSLGLRDPAEMYISILKSRSVGRDIVGQFQLQRVFNTTNEEDSLRVLSARSTFASGKDSMIRISVEDAAPQRAADLANAYITALSKQNSRLAITESAQRRLFFERAVDGEKNALVNAENTLRETQQRTGFVEVTGQAQVVIASIAQLRAQIAMREVGLQRLRAGATPQNPEVVGQETELASLRTQLSKLEAGSSHQRSGDPFIPVTNIAKSGLEYVRALRDVKYHEILFEALSKQYEAARIDEAKEAPVIQVIDYAVPPGKKSSPHRAQLAVVGALLSGLAGCLYVRLRAGRYGEPETPAGVAAA